MLGCNPPIDHCYNPLLVPTNEILRKEHKQHFVNQLEAGVDFILLETQCVAREAIVAAQVAREVGRG